MAKNYSSSSSDSENENYREINSSSESKIEYHLGGICSKSTSSPCDYQRENISEVVTPLKFKSV